MPSWASREEDFGSRCAVALCTSRTLVCGATDSFPNTLGPTTRSGVRMARRVWLCVVAGVLQLGVSFVATAQSTFTLARDGQPACTIVVADRASLAAHLAALELQYHILKISGADLPIRSDKETVSGPRVLVGESQATQALGLKGADFASQEYLIAFRPDAIILMGRDWEDTEANRREFGWPMSEGTEARRFADPRRLLEIERNARTQFGRNRSSRRVRRPGYLLRHLRLPRTILRRTVVWPIGNGCSDPRHEEPDGPRHGRAPRACAEVPRRHPQRELAVHEGPVGSRLATGGRVVLASVTPRRREVVLQPHVLPHDHQADVHGSGIPGPRQGPRLAVVLYEPEVDREDRPDGARFLRRQDRRTRRLESDG